MRRRREKSNKNGQPPGATLKTVINTEPPDAAAEKFFHDLLKTVAPTWPGFTPEEAKEDKLKAIDAAVE